MKIRVKIMASFFCLVALLLGVVTTAYHASTSVNFFRKQSLIREEELEALTNLRAQVRNQLLETYEVAFVEGVQNHAQDLELEKQLVQAKLMALEAVVKQDLSSDSLLKLRNEYENMNRGLDQVIQYAKENRLNESRSQLLAVRQDKFNQGFIKLVTSLIDSQKEMAKESRQNLEMSIHSLQNKLILFTWVALLLAGGLAWFISNSIGRRLENLEKATYKIASGNFDSNLPTEGVDELSALSKAFNQMALSLTEMRDKILKQQEIVTYSSKMSALGEMAGGVAHEINTPLAIIGIRIDQMEEIITESNIQNVYFQDSLKVVRTTVERIAKIINGLRSFAREGRVAPPQKVKLNELIEETLSFCQERFASHGVALQLKPCQSFVNLEVECRSVEISQVLLNLLNNAYDAVELLNEKWIAISIDETGDYVEISITDSGRGIPEEVQNKIMQPFFTTKDIGKGTGLGLSISKGIIDRHQGQFFLDKKSNHTKFTIILPKRQLSIEKRDHVI